MRGLFRKKVWEASNIGNLLLKLGYVDKDQIQQAVLEKARIENDADDVRLGQVMVGLGMVTQEQLREALESQVRMRRSTSAATEEILRIVEKRTQVVHDRMFAVAVK